MTNSSKLKILIVDDDPIIRKTLSALLSSEGHLIEKVSSDSKALEISKKKYYDILFIDFIMPKMTDLELLEEFHKQHPETAPIMISGNADMNTVIKALRLGAVDFLTKPIDSLELNKSVNNGNNILRKPKS